MRKIVKLGVLLGVVASASLPVFAGAQAPTIEIVSPRNGATVAGPKVEVRVRVTGVKLVDAGQPVKDGEGHAHVFVNREVTRAGTVIPTDQVDIVHFGRAPYDTRTLDLQPGQYRLQAVLGDASHKTLQAEASPVTTITVTAAGESRPQRPAKTGDGSLATEGVGVGALLAVGLAVVALAARRLARR